MFVVVPFVGGVPMAVVYVVHVIAVLHGLVTAARLVPVLVLTGLVPAVLCWFRHWGCLPGRRRETHDPQAAALSGGRGPPTGPRSGPAAEQAKQAHIVRGVRPGVDS